jgi:hypothetical protein
MGTTEQLTYWGIELEDGQRAHFFDFDEDDEGRPDALLFEGTVHYDAARGEWYALIDWDSFRHESEERNRDPKGKD